MTKTTLTICCLQHHYYLYLSYYFILFASVQEQTSKCSTRRAFSSFVFMGCAGETGKMNMTVLGTTTMFCVSLPGHRFTFPSWKITAMSTDTEPNKDSASLMVS